MNPQTKVLLFLERNNSISVNHSGKLASQPRMNISIPSSRESSIASARSMDTSRHSRSRSLLSASPRPPQDKLSKIISNYVYELLSQQEKKKINSSRFLSQEAKLLKTLDSLIKKEKQKKVPLKVEESPEVRKNAEKIAAVEREVQNLIKNNKAMKTLLAELTLSQVDAKISSTNGRRNIEVLNPLTYIKRHSNNKKVDRKLLDSLINARVQPLDYGSEIQSIVEQWMSTMKIDPGVASQIICTRILTEQDTRLASEESADNSIAEKEKTIRLLELSIQKLSPKPKK